MPEKDAAERAQVTAELLHALDAAYAVYFNHSNHTLLRHQRTKAISTPWTALQDLDTQAVKSVSAPCDGTPCLAVVGPCGSLLVAHSCLLFFFRK